MGRTGIDKDKFGYPLVDNASRKPTTRGVCNHFVLVGGLRSYGRWKFSGGCVVIDLRLQESAAMLAVEAGGKKGGADLGGEVRQQ